MVEAASLGGILTIWKTRRSVSSSGEARVAGNLPGSITLTNEGHESSRCRSCNEKKLIAAILSMACPLSLGAQDENENKTETLYTSATGLRIEQKGSKAIRLLLPPAEFAKIKQEQIAWVKKRDASNSVAERSKLTEERSETLQKLVWVEKKSEEQ
jgi:uncharacterized protein YecT (DUF1311 family)